MLYTSAVVHAIHRRHSTVQLAHDDLMAVHNLELDDPVPRFSRLHLRDGLSRKVASCCVVDDLFARPVDLL